MIFHGYCPFNHKTCFSNMLCRIVSRPRVCLGAGHFDHVPRGLTQFSAVSTPISFRRYHDESFGFRKRQEYVFPDCNTFSPSFHLLPVIVFIFF